MTDVQERRDPATERVKVATLVEICGNIPGIPVFEAESVDVSARGMHLRTAYLPEAGAPLVCRFESDGREIVVEGTVAWRREGSRGGEFGVTFTALDSRSVDALRGLCGPHDQVDEKPQSQVNEPGARVRLHIEGLGSPMKARVKTGTAAKVQVGSSLEFLKVGRRLEIEDLDLGARRPAEIDTVSVMVDPSTQVPQLVVGLRFEGAEESTPSPTVAATSQSEREAKSLRIPASRVSTDVASGKSPAAANAGASQASEEEDDAEPEMRGRVAAMAANAEQKAKVASERLAVVGSAAARGAAGWFKSAAGKVLELKQKRAEPPRRTTSPTKSALSTEKPRLRPQSGAASANEGEPARRVSRRAMAVGGGVSLVAVAAIALALRGPSAPPPGAKTAAQGATDAVAASGEAPTSLPGKAADGVLANNPSAPGAKGPVTANVPLFGPTPLTTTEPAPLGPPPGTDAAGLEASEKADARASLASRGADQGFAEEEEGPSRGGERDSAEGKSSSSKSDKKPEDVAPWGHGRVHEPTIHRLRLDGPGAKLSGTVDPTGFTVVVPERKVMEAPNGIAKRDARIARIRAVNTPNGAQISFRFKDSVPSYRVRLRRDYVEFLISEPSAEAKDSKGEKSSDSSKKKLSGQAR
jgi:hypothetical protein